MFICVGLILQNFKCLYPCESLTLCIPLELQKAIYEVYFT